MTKIEKNSLLDFRDTFTRFPNRGARSLTLFGNGFDIFSCAVAVCSKGCMWAVAAAMGTVTCAVWAVTASMWSVAGTMETIIGA